MLSQPCGFFFIINFIKQPIGITEEKEQKYDQRKIEVFLQNGMAT